MKQTTNVASGYLCHCLRITTDRFGELMEETPHPTFEALKREHGIGSLCSSCEYEAKGELQEYLMLHPEKAKAPTGVQGLRHEMGYAWRELKRRTWNLLYGNPSAGLANGAAKAYHTGIFFMRRDGLESHLVASNLRFPEHAQNINGAQASFRATLFGENGAELATSRPMSVADGATVELSPTDLFPEVKGDFVGGLYVEYDSLLQTGSLRPYGVMVSTSPAFRARCHYHDKFGLVNGPGFFQNTSPFEPGQDCWMAAANCQPLPYRSKVFLKMGITKFSADVELGPMAAAWLKLADLFPEVASVPVAERSPALLWLENPQHIMVYFYWFNAANATWMGQHH